MTRINVIHPMDLCDKHLMAEYRELIRIPNAVWSGKMKTSYPDAPNRYVLGAGHVKFFVDKLHWLFWRHLDLYRELDHRGFNVTFMDWEDHKTDFFRDNNIFNEYFPTEDARRLNLDRIIERLPTNPKFTNRTVPDYVKNLVRS